jgi:poly(beta-D-mannuronate) lyase
MVNQKHTFNKSLYTILALLIFTFSCGQKENSAVKNLDELNAAVAAAQPGTTITMANGIWENVEIVFIGKGTKEAPITLTAETPGEVIISGQSNLQFSGEYLVVSNLVFKNGYTPAGDVINFRTGKNLANNCRLTNCVIDNFSNPERFDSDTWVMVHGKNNVVDHNSFVGKGNQGVTLAIRMDTLASQENGHIIEYNYFGPRPVLGSNGGETVRIGTSHYSRSYSNSIVRSNYFDRANGEHEIISNKSCGNQFMGNVFYECQGTLTMRHGHHTLVENNYFIGNGKQNTGGIRIINEYQTVRKNYLYGLTGHRFRGALVIMNGVPNSPINRYNQVVDSEMNNNLVIDSDYIQFCAGSDKERSAVPVGSAFKNNAILTKTNLDPFTVYDDISGIAMEGNLLSDNAKVPIENGFEKVAYDVTKNEAGLWVPNDKLLEKIGFGKVALPVEKNQTGASYYSKDDLIKPFGSGAEIQVASGTNTLLEALNASKPGDVLMLENGGKYLMTKYAMINHPITIKTNDGAKAMIQSEKQSFFRIENGGALQLTNVIIDGAASPDQAGNNVISTSKYSMNKNYALVVENCEVRDLDKNHTFDFLKSYKHTFADSINIINTTMTNVTGSIMNLDQEVEDLGIYNVENVNIIGSTFTDVQGVITNVYRGGTDESTFGPIMTISDVVINNSGKGSRNKIGAVLRFHGVQKLDVSNVKINGSAGIDLYQTNGDPISVLKNIELKDSGKIVSNNNAYTQENIKVVK